MKKILIIVGSLAAASLIGFGIYKAVNGSKPSLERFDAITGIATYKYKGKTLTINVKDGGGAQIGEYQILPITLKVNVSGKNIGDVVGVQLTKSGQVINELRS
jgi:hypothetical protein